MSTAKIKSPDNGADHFSCGGEEFTAGKDGLFEVPVHIAVEMTHHGFEIIPEAPAKPAGGNAQQGKK